MSRLSPWICMACALSCPLQAGAQDAADLIAAWLVAAEKMSSGKTPDAWVPALAAYWPKLCELNSLAIGEGVSEQCQVGKGWLVAYSLFLEARLPLWYRQRGIVAPTGSTFQTIVLNGFTTDQVVRGKGGMMHSYGFEFLGTTVTNPLRVPVPEFESQTGNYITQAVAAWLQAYPHEDQGPTTSNWGGRRKPGDPVGFAGPEAEWCAKVLPQALAGRRRALQLLSNAANDTDEASELHLQATSLAACTLYYCILHQVGTSKNYWADKRFFTPVAL